ncbi:Noc2p family protein [Giardia muris]|uniref:Noc2p family protein n=1 Tax=Giardia muris TaxID=5742 RepID=A0A4Z1T2P1_GIAMU|nr:Noc2p family protein [Giardia muris]|eukprot:TNJ29918.1 Noc2p family protein [Giardia muris]
MSSTDLSSITVSSLEVSDNYADRQILTLEMVTDLLDDFEGEGITPSDDSVTTLVQYCTLMTDTAEESSKAIIEDGVYSILSSHAASLLPLYLPKITNRDLRQGLMRQLFSSILRLIEDIETSSATEQRMVPTLVRLMTNLLDPTILDNTEREVRPFLRTIIKTIMRLYISDLVLQGFLSQSMAEAHSLTDLLEKETKLKEQSEANEPLLGLACIDLFRHICRSLGSTYSAILQEQEQVRILRLILVTYLQHQRRPLLAQLPGLDLQRNLLIYALSQVDNTLLQALFILLSRELVSHSRASLTGHGNLLFIQGKSKVPKHHPKTRGKTKEKDGLPLQYKNLCSWVHVETLDVIMSLIVTTNCIDLLHPYLDILFSLLDFVPTGLRFYPFRLRIFQMLLRVSERMPNFVFVPMLHVLMEMFIECAKPMKTSGTDINSIGKWRGRVVSESVEGEGFFRTVLSLRALLVAPKDLVDTIDYRRTAFYNTLNLFCRYIRRHEWHPAFPELVQTTIIHLKHLVLGMQRKEPLLGTMFTIKYPPVLRSFYLELQNILDTLRKALSHRASIVRETRLEVDLSSRLLLGADYQSLPALARFEQETRERERKDLPSGRNRQLLDVLIAGYIDTAPEALELQGLDDAKETHEDEENEDSNPDYNDTRPLVSRDHLNNDDDSLSSSLDEDNIPGDEKDILEPLDMTK